MTRRSSVEITLLGNRGIFKTREALDRAASYVHEEMELLLEIANEEAKSGDVSTSGGELLQKCELDLV